VEDCESAVDALSLSFLDFVFGFVGFIFLDFNFGCVDCDFFDRGFSETCLPFVRRLEAVVAGVAGSDSTGLCFCFAIK
jgi:hypothetical protein